MPPNGLVTGCAGFIGSHLCERLVKEGWNVTGIDDLSTGSRENLSSLRDNENFRFIETDITKPELIDPSIFDGIDCVFHHAGKKMVFSNKQPREDLLTNIYGTLNMLLLSAEKNVKRFIFASTIAVYGNPKTTPTFEDSPTIATTPYGVSKFSCEEYCRLWFRQHKLPIVILRYASVYGPRQALDVGMVPIFTAKILQNEPITVYGDGSQIRSLTYVDDVVQANILAANAGKQAIGQTFNVSSNCHVSIKDTVRLISERLKRQPKVNFEPERPGDIKVMVPDISKISKVMGYKPGLSIEQAIARTTEYYEKKYL